MRTARPGWRFWQGLTPRNLALLLLLVLVVISLFALLDYLAHSLSEEYAVPPYYFRNKVIFGTLIGFAACLLTRNRGLFTRSLAFSSSVSVLLQVRYFLEGYPPDFVVTFLFIHFLILLPVSLLAFRLAGERMWK